jgi:hypothetical protein
MGALKSKQHHVVFLIFAQQVVNSVEFSWFLSVKVRRAEKTSKNLRFSHTFCGFMTLDSEATLPNHGKTLCFHRFSAESIEKNIVLPLLVEIAAAVDEEPGEPGEVVDGGTKK